MCGRTSLFATLADLEETFDARPVADGGSASHASGASSDLWSDGGEPSDEGRRPPDRSSGQRGGTPASNETAEPSRGPREDDTGRTSPERGSGGWYRPRYNIAPGEPLEVITNDAPGRIDRFHWGLLPPWADEGDEGFINARSETAAEKRSFADAWESRPCLVLSSGFYEWKATNGGPKRPYRIHREDAPAFAMAGLWEVWEGDGREIPSVTILTTAPNDLMEPIHDRMPVVLPSDEEEAWLTGGPDERAELCRPYPGADLDAYEISTRVNDPTNDDPSVIEPLGHEQSGLGEF